jgi:hypothetical protein
MVEITCPKCKNLLRIKVEAAMLANAVSPPISITHIHDDPKYSIHSATIWVDKNYDIRAVEASDSTILDRGIQTGGGSSSAPPQRRQLTRLFPDEVEVTDKAVNKLKEFLESTGRLSAEIAREFTDAYSQFTKLSEIIQRKKRTARRATVRRAQTEKPEAVTKIENQ